MKLLINRMMVRKAPSLTVDMRSRVNRLLTRNDQRVYAEQLEKDLTAGIITASKMATNWTKYMQISMEAKRHEANIIRARTERQLVAWGFGQPPTEMADSALNPNRGVDLRRTRKQKTPQPRNNRDSQGTGQGLEWRNIPRTHHLAAMGSTTTGL
jgi:hypothetical protein